MQPRYHFAKPLLGIVCLVLLIGTGEAFAQTTTFTYQGRLTDANFVPDGKYEMRFKLFDAVVDGNQIVTTLTFDGSSSNPPVTVTNGIFTVQLDFGAEAFPGADRFLEVAIRYPGDIKFTPLSPRQQLTSTPYAIRTLSATAADSLSRGCNGCVLDAHIQSVTGDKVSGTVATAATATTATTAGNVTGVVQINHGGTGSSTQNFVDLSMNQTIGGEKEFTGEVRVTGNGLFKGNGAGLTNLNFGNLADGAITQAKLAYGATSRYNLQLLGMLRWDLLPTSRTIAVGGEPFALAFDGTFIYVANSSSNTVTRIRASTGVVEGSPIGVGSGPGALAFDGTFIYVAHTNGNNVRRIRASTGTVEGDLIPVGNRPRALVFDGTFIYVANSFGGSVTRIRASTGAVEGSPIVINGGVSSPYALTFDGTYIYVANRTGSNVVRIRASTGLVEGSPISLGAGNPEPQALAFDGTFIYVANFASNNVMRIRASTGAVQGGPIGVGFGPRALTFDGTFIYVANLNSNTVMRIRASTGQVEGGPISVGGLPGALVYDGTFIYVANFGNNNVTRF